MPTFDDVAGLVVFVAVIVFLLGFGMLMFAGAMSILKAVGVCG